jgi:hypothetical protein
MGCAIPYSVQQFRAHESELTCCVFLGSHDDIVVID